MTKINVYGNLEGTKKHRKIPKIRTKGKAFPKKNRKSQRRRRRNTLTHTSSVHVIPKADAGGSPLLDIIVCNHRADKHGIIALNTTSCFIVAIVATGIYNSGSKITRKILIDLSLTWTNNMDQLSLPFQLAREFFESPQGFVRGTGKGQRTHNQV